jgi:UPF0716 protein FxsA
VRFFAFFTLVALAEMATFFWVGSWIGFGWAFGLAVATAIIGSVLVRRAGLSVLGRIQSRVNQGQVPGRELIDGAAILLAGAFLISPGFITDTMGFLLLIPVVRRFVSDIVSRRLSKRVTLFTGGRFSAPTRDENVIDIDPIDIEELD